MGKKFSYLEKLTVRFCYFYGRFWSWRLKWDGSGLCPPSPFKCKNTVKIRLTNENLEPFFKCLKLGIGKAGEASSSHLYFLARIKEKKKISHQNWLHWLQILVAVSRLRSYNWRRCRQYGLGTAHFCYTQTIPIMYMVP